MTQQPLIISGSAREQSHTNDFLNQVFRGRQIHLIHLLDYNIAPYDYSGNYGENDDFFQLADKLLQHNVIVFATPVYWYAMSGLMKIFFDRITDLVTTKKQIGRQLKGKSTFLIAVGADKTIPEGFEVPFKRTSDYLDMHYQGFLYHTTKHPEAAGTRQKEIKTFIEKMETVMLQ